MANRPLDIRTRADLAAFVESLVVDLRRNPVGWENTDLESFLEALSAYLRDLPGWAKNVDPEVDPEEAAWRLFAVALAGAAVYE